MSDLHREVRTEVDGHRRLPTFLLDTVGRQPSWVIAAVSLATIALVASGDYATGQDISFSAFYLLPVLIAVSKGSRIGTRMAVCSALAWFVADLAGRSTPYESMYVPLWNLGVRFLVFWLVVALAHALTGSLEHEQELSRRDQLTGLANWRAFHELAEVERRRLVRTNRPLTVAYIDIDDFKTVNDTFGHAVGDLVIATVGRILATGLRDSDAVARLGGDEFAVLLPETDRVSGGAVIDRLHLQLTAEVARRGWPIGFSIGVVTFTDAPSDVADLVTTADRLMYEVKRNGKRAVKAA